MTDKISESGMISRNGEMLLPMDRINAFCAAHKGDRIVLRIVAAEPGSSKAQQAYYYNYILPTISQALHEQGTRKGEKAVDRWLLAQYPGDKSESEIGLGEEVLEARYLTRSQMSDFLEWLKQYAAENLFVYIEDPQTL